MTAPDRIWLDWPAANKGDVVYDEPPERDTQPGQTEYIRADLVMPSVNAGLKNMSDWSGLPDVYVTGAKSDGIVWQIEACSVPMAIGPEVRLVHATRHCSPAVLAADETVLAMVGAVIEEAAGCVDDDQIAFAMNQRICCDGRECGCMGAAVGSYLEWHIRALTPADAAAALAARDNRIRDEALEDIAERLTRRAGEIESLEDDHYGDPREYAADILTGEAAAIRALKGDKP